MTGRTTLMTLSVVEDPWASRQSRLIPWATITCLMSLPVIPGTLNKFGGGVVQQAANAAAMISPLARLFQVLLSALLLLLCLILFWRGAEDLGDKDSLGSLGLALGLWLYMSGVVYAASQEFSTFFVVFPILLVSWWAARPPFSVLSVIGSSGAVTATWALVMGIFWPEFGLYVNDLGQQAVSDKGVVSGNLLSGPFTSTNNLGQYVVLTIPFLFLLRHRMLRVFLLFPSVTCVVWTGSRSSLFALAMAIFIWLFFRRLDARRWLLPLVTMGMVASFMVAIVGRNWPDSFSGRGAIWSVSLLNLEQQGWLFGLGDRWYSELAGRRTELGDRADFLAFHAHNQFLHILVVAGLVGLVFFALFLLSCVRNVTRLDFRCGQVFAAWVAIFLVSGALELNLDPFDRVQFFGQALVPLIAIAFQRSANPELGGRYDR